MFARIAIQLLLVFVLVAAQAAHAGYVQTEKDGGVTFISGGKVKSVSAEDEEWTVIDLSKATLMVVNERERTVMTGTIDEFCQAMQGMFGAMAEFMGGASRFGMPMGQQQPGAVPAVKVVDAGAGGIIAGLRTRKYEIYQGDELVEELWVARQASLLKELGNSGSMARLSACTAGMAGEPSYEESPEYMAVLKNGWPLRLVTHEDGEAEVDTDVVKLEQRAVPDSEFAPPKGYRRASFQESMDIDG